MVDSWITKNKQDLQKVISVEKEQDSIFIKIDTSSSSQSIKDFLDLYIEELVDDNIGIYEHFILTILERDISRVDEDFFNLLSLPAITKENTIEKKENRMIAVTEDGKKIILNINGTWEEDTEIKSLEEDEFEFEFSDKNDLFDDFDDEPLETKKPSNPWDAAEYIAEEAYYGLHDELEEIDKALKYYKEAFKQGSPTAPFMIGKIYSDDVVIKKNKKLAMDFFKEGVVRNDNRCWKNIGLLYAESNYNNTIKAFKKYLLSEMNEENIFQEEHELANNILEIYNSIDNHVFNIQDIDDDMFEEIFYLLFPYKEILLDRLNYSVKYLEDKLDSNYEEQIHDKKKSIKYIEVNLFELR